MTDASTWLFQLGANRPRHTAVLTQEILDRTGPPPLFAHHGAGPDTARYIVGQVLPLLADDNARRAAQRARQLLTDGAAEREIHDARAEVRFWNSVSKWIKSWAEGNFDDPVRCRRVLGRIPAPRAACA